MDSVLKRVEGALESSLDRIAPRAIGSQRVPPEQELEEYLLSVADTPNPEAALWERYSDLAQQYGPPVARRMIIEYVEQNEAALKRLVERKEGS